MRDITAACIPIVQQMVLPPATDYSNRPNLRKFTDGFVFISI
jgi:hypothetical protein